MKIVSKDGIQSSNIQGSSATQRPKQRPRATQPTHQNTTAPRPIKQSPPRQTHKKHVEGKRTHSNQTPKKAAVPQKKPTAAPRPINDNSLYNRFISLLRFNITFKLTIGYSLRLIRFILFFVILCYGAFTYYLYFSTDNAILAHQNYLKTYFEASDTTPANVEHYLKHNHLSLYVFGADKNPIYSNSSYGLDYNTAIREERFKISQFPNFPDAVAYGSLGNSPFENGKYYAIRLERTEASQTIEATFPVAIVLAFACMITAITSSSRLARKHLKPIYTITEQVQEMSANNLSTRINVSGTKDELKDLALTFNTMLDDIQQSYEREKQFVSDASHELRTPIAVIKGYGGMLKRWGKDDPNVLEESIDAIVGETNNMQSLVESLLFIARNDKGTLKMDKESFNFSMLLEEIVKETHLIDTDHKILDQIESNIFLYGSSEKLKQAIRIFVDNSMKYTPNEGEVRIQLNRSNDHIILSISDNGIGISKEDLPHIFDRFYRADKSRTKMKDNQHGGTGLGLSIAKIIMEQHDGTIKVSSELNVGTEFLIKLPIAKI